MVEVDTGKARCEASPDLWGIFFEDINLSLDGGIYAEMVRNRNFADAAGERFGMHLEYWNPVGGAECFLEKTKPVSKGNREYVCVRGPSDAGIANEGYFGFGIEKDKTYRLGFQARVPTDTKLTVALERYNRPPVAEAKIKLAGGDEWREYRLELRALDTDAQARLVIRMPEGGEVALDCVSMFPSDAVAGLFRRDLVERLRALKPSFMRFPGGCWVEGETMKDAYRWKTTLGSVWERRTQWNIWKYWSTNGVGYHEYLLLAEAIGAKPLFCINCGMSHKETVPMAKMDEFVQDALDAIEYANGPTNSLWGAKRAAAGHPEPFNLAYLEIGNENGGPEYEERYKLIADAVRAKHPEVKLIFDKWKSTSSITNGAPYDLRDDHFYRSAEAFMGAEAHVYDGKHYDFGVFVGEYAVTRGVGRYGDMKAAIGEAAFMLGLERNQDKVKLAAYAPLFANAQHTVWSPNLIYPLTIGSFTHPSWTVQKLFSENRGAEVLNLKIATSSREYVERDRKGDRRHRIDAVQASALRTTDGAYILKLVNTTDVEQSVEIKGDGLSGRPGTRTMFGGFAADAHNSPAAPDALKERVSPIDRFSGVEKLPPLSLTILRLENPDEKTKVGGFWGKKYRMLTVKWLPHCIREMEKGGQGEEYLNLVATAEKLAGKTPSVKFKGCKWSDAYPYNIIESACLALEIDPGEDEEWKSAQEYLRAKIEEWIPTFLAAQEPCGYTHSYHGLNDFPHFRKEGDHEFYVMGYFIEMGIAHYRMTKGKDRRLFDAAIRCADHLCEVFGPAPKRTWMNGHPGLELALQKLSDATGDGKYADLARFFVLNQNPLDSDKMRTAWHKCPCCVGNIPRTLFALKDHLYRIEGDTVYLDHYMDFENGDLKMTTGYPFDGKVKVELKNPAIKKIVARYPWRDESKLYTASPALEHGYNEISFVESASRRTIEFELPFAEQKVIADERVTDCRGLVAYQTGPIVWSWQTHDAVTPAVKVANYDRLNSPGYARIWISDSTNRSDLLVESVKRVSPMLGMFHSNPTQSRRLPHLGP